MKRYLNDEFGFSINVPRGDWEVEERVQQLSPRLYLVVFLFCPPRTRDGFTPNVNVLIEEISSSVDIDTYTAETERLSKQMSKSYRRRRMRRLTKDGIDFTELVYSAVEEGRHLKHKQLKCIHRERAYVVTATDLKQNYHLMKSDFTAVIESFKLL